jgi:hypothetical protein
MPTTPRPPAFILSIGIVILAAVQAAGGLLFPGLYRDNALVSAVWLGNDVVTLVVIVPLLAVMLFLARRGSPRATLVWLGLLDYALYNYAFYLFGAAFNSHFLIYAALFALAGYALIASLTSIDAGALSRPFLPHRPVRLVAMYLALVALVFGGLWAAMSLGFVITGQVPGPVISSGHITAVVFALDLSLVVPGMALGAVWLWQRRPWGVVLAAMFSVKGAAYMLALTAGTISAMRVSIPGAGAELPIWAFTGFISLAAVWLLLSPRAPSGVQAQKPAVSTSQGAT